jgi:hypothetical protein
MAIKRPKLMSKFAKERDLECHVRTHSILGSTFVEIRDYIPSTKTYSRGFTVEAIHLPRLIEELQTVQDHLGNRTSSSSQIEGQQVLPGFANV